MKHKSSKFSIKNTFSGGTRSPSAKRILFNDRALRCLRLVISSYSHVVVFVDASPCENQRKTSFNGELNGLLGAELIGAGDRSTMAESTGPNSENMNTQECQIM